MQMKLGTHGLDYGMLKRLLLQMLQMPWGSKHSYTDHHETTNSCLLCKVCVVYTGFISVSGSEIGRSGKRDKGIYAAVHVTHDMIYGGLFFSCRPRHSGSLSPLSCLKRARDSWRRRRGREEGVGRTEAVRCDYSSRESR